MDNRRSTSMSDNSLPDNNRCHMLHTVPLHIRPEKLRAGLRKGSASTRKCDAWISLWFSSDLPLSMVLISLLSRGYVCGLEQPFGPLDRMVSDQKGFSVRFGLRA